MFNTFYSRGIDKPRIIWYTGITLEKKGEMIMERDERLREYARRTKIVDAALELLDRLDAEAFLYVGERTIISSALFILDGRVDNWNHFHADLEATGSPRRPE